LLPGAELRSAFEGARADLQGRELVVEMKHITTISQEGENVLLQLMTGDGSFLVPLLLRVGVG
jgi:hypothetical protein